MKGLFYFSIALLTVYTVFWQFRPEDTSTYTIDPSNIQVAPIINDSIPPDSLPYPVQQADPFDPNPVSHPLFLNNPSNMKDTVIYDPESNEYIVHRRIGDRDYLPPLRMSFEEYLQYDFNKSMNEYWRERSAAETRGRSGGGLIPSINIGGSGFENVFGSNTIDIRPQGSAELIFGVNANRRDDPALSVKQRRTANFDFQEKIQMNVTAKIGDKIDFGVKYNTESSFEFENKMKLQYEGKEDEIIRRIEAGDVTMPLNSSLITGSQSLFGIKTQLQFGKATVTTVVSQQKSQTSNITVSGGAQTSDFELTADEYEEKKHYFTAQYFRSNYNKWLDNLPIVNSPINITKMEVWVTNIGPATQENRNIVAFMDIGEYNPYNDNFGPQIQPDAIYPSNRSNNLFNVVDINQLRDINSVNSYLNGVGLDNSIDYEKVENARKLAPTEYSYNSKLGFISLNSALNDDQVLAVAYQYTVLGSDSVYQVGEFSTGGVAAPGCLVVKLLKSTAANTHIPLWDLMMKNVYAIGGYQVNPDDFRLDVLYKSESLGVPAGFLMEGNIQGISLIRVLNLDNLNANMDPEPDGVFDFINNAATEGGTIQAANGRIFFPVLEPFGQDLRDAIGDQALADKYCYDSLYTMTKTGARQYPNKNRFLIAGTYKSAVGSEISLNAMNIPQGSVKVTAGGILLAENVDYTVDYTLGRVKIINEGILNSGAPINISLESNSLFSIQTKTFLGTHVDYQISKDFLVGGTILNLTERPFTYKVNFGEEPISNTIWGMNLSYQTESNLITKLVDKLPFYNTKAPSRVSIESEFANLIPGHARAIGKMGTAYIDDFEGSKSSIDIKNVGNWFLASTPQGQPSLFPEADDDSLLYNGMNRAKLAWYVIDPLFFRNNNLTPDHIKNDPNMQSNHFMREVLETEVFPAKENPNGIPTNIAVLDLAYYPAERGPYNFDVTPSAFSSGIDGNGNLNDPASRWGGIMRKIETPDFEETNVEYIEFWVMDPFIDNPSHTGGKLYVNLGDISEDVLRDHRKSYENGLPTSATITNVDTTQWGRVPLLQALVNSFDNDPTSRTYQDVGLDGLGDDDEIQFYQDAYVDAIASTFGTGSAAYSNASNDPSGDNYHYFRGDDFDQAELNILDRYKFFNGLEGNSPTSEQSPEEYPTSSTTLPNVEDINRDNTLSEAERYFQYIIDLHPSKMNIGENYITDIYTATPTLANQTTASVKWYQFKIPIKNPDQVIGNIQDFKSIRFIRLFLTDFSEPIVLRFATLELVRSQWRKYDYSLLAPGEYLPGDEQNLTDFEISAVNVEENGTRQPIPYLLPPGIEREINYATTNLQKLNEQSLVLKVCHLIDGDARAVYKTTEFDLRQYKRLKMYIHSELSNQDEYTFNPGDLTLFIRLGTDFTNNYYEYEVPLNPSPLNLSVDEANRPLVWKDSLDIQLSQFVEIKKDRNIAMRQDGSVITLTTPYYQYDGANRITVLGIPNLSDVKTIMIGIRNPKQSTITGSDDGLPKCAEIWVNELRLSDFDEDGGWAATTRVTADLADLGNIMLAGNVSTAGFGSIEKKVNERQKENIMSYDVATNIELGKFFPEKIGLKIPMHYDYSETFSNPQYNPLNPDIYLKDDLETYSSDAERDSIINLVQDYTRRKSINFINVRKEKTGEKAGKVHLYDISNFDFTYAYNELFHRNIDIEYNLQKSYRGALGYNYTNNPKNFTPFKNVKFLNKHKVFRLVSDFNFFLMPKSVSFRTDLDRGYEENLWRNKTEALLIIEPTYLKTFNWNRVYDVKFDLTKGLKLEYSAVANARVDEPPGRIDREDSDYEFKRDSIWENIRNMGRMTNYTQSTKLNYSIPINKIPIMDWISSSVQYAGTYRWTAAPLYKDSLGNYSEHPFGNTIENSNTISLTANGNMVSLYNKIGYLKKLNSTNARPTGSNRREGNPMDEEADTAKKEDINIGKIALDNFLKLLMMVKNVSLTYSEGNGTLLPGYRGKPVTLGMDPASNAPGWGFVFGDQQDIRSRLVGDSLITTDSLLNNPFMTKHNENLSARVTIEPLKSLKVEVTATRNYSINHSEFFRYDGSNGFRSYSPADNGNFSITIITWKTAFVTDNDDYSNQTFEQFKNYRQEVANLLASSSPNWDQTYYTDTITGQLFPTGYGPTSQDVLIPAFLAAYTGKSPNGFTKSRFPKIPLPNWRITYNGLTSLAFFKKHFKSVTVSHAYRSTYNVGGFNTNVLFTDPDADGFTTVKDAMDNFLPRYEIAQISITEQYSPFINLDLTWKNSLITKFEFKKSRNLSLSFSNNQLTEVLSNEITIGTGYRFKEVKFIIGTGRGGKRTLTSDLNLKADLSIRSNKTILRKIVEDYDQISAGQRVISINISADYQVSPKFTIRAFFDKVINNPFVSSQFPNSNTNAGISLRFSLAQ